jgi:hypothetical protein
VINSNPSDNPALNSAPVKSGGFKRFGKKLYAAAAVLAILLIALTLFIPQSAAAIALDVNYVVGEKMVYNTTASVSVELDSPFLSASLKTPNTTSFDYTETVEITAFDGEYYTLNHTTLMELPIISTPFSFSVLEKMNKTGYSTYMLGLSSIGQEVTSQGLSGNSFLVQLLSKPEVKVGETITIPYPVYEGTYLQVTGDLTVSFGQVEMLTVPAGTYSVFKIGMTSSNIKMQIINVPEETQSYVTSDFALDIDVHYQVYLEYGSLRQIKSSMEQSGSLQSSLLNYTSQYAVERTLNQHIKP